MRLTKVLCQLNYNRHFKRVWKKQGKMEIKDLEVPAELQALGVEIKDAREILLEAKIFKPPVKTVNPKAIPPSVFQNKKWFYHMHAKTKVSENENQTLALTKTVRYQGLPKMINSLIGVESLPKQDELVQTSLLQAQVWDASQHKLPKKIDFTRPGWVFKREYGIRYKNKVSGFLEKLSNLCDAPTGKYDGCFQRNKIFQALSEISFERCGDNVTFQMPCDILVTSTKPLKRFASVDEVASTEKEAVPNIYPIKPTLDLDKFEESPLIQNEQYAFPLNENLHTLFIAQKSFGFWFPKQLLARSIATCFAFAAASARRKYGESVKKLPEPISFQCMYMDIKSFNFMAYQLNTLDLDHDEGVKNQVWIDEPVDLYEEVSEKNLITNYNSAVFPKMLALNMNGLIPVN